MNSKVQSVPPVWKRDWFWGVLLIAGTLAAYWPALHAGFIWDDDAYVTENRAVQAADGLKAIWLKPEASPQYYPLVFTSFWLEYHLWGLKPLGYHLVNVLLHGANAVLVWLVLRRMGVRGGWWVGAIFAVHPVMVESVAWVTERKNVLSTLFYLLAVLGYLRFRPLGGGGGGSGWNWRYYPWVLVLFLCALLSKTVTCTLPAALLLMGWWKRGRVERGDVLAVVPLFVMGIALGFMTAWLEKYHVGASGADWQLSFVGRCLLAGRVLWFYAGKLMCPHPLIFIYPRWQINAGEVRQYVYIVAVLVVVVGLWLWRRRIGRGPLAAVLFFVGTLVPALGFIDVYPFLYSFVADHFQYLASIGLIGLVAGAVTMIIGRMGRLGVMVGGMGGIVILLMLGMATWVQTHVYTDLETLWRTTIARNPGCWMAHNNLGVFLDKKAQGADAINQFQEAIRLKPDYAEPQNNLGNVFLKKSQLTEAIEQYQEALRLKPDFAEAHNNFGNALFKDGRLDEAIAQYQAALRLKPDYADAHNNLGNALLKQGRFDEAIAQLQEAIQLKPEDAEVHYNLGVAFDQQGRAEEAVSEYRAALRLRPDYAEAHFNLGNTLGRAGRTEEAISEYEAAIRLRPGFAEAHCGLGTAFGMKGEVAEALEQYEAAIRLRPDYAEAHENLGKILERQGRLREAAGEYRTVIKLRPDDGGARVELAWLLATSPEASLRDGKEAVELAEWVRAPGGEESAQVLDTLGAAYAEAGEFEKAVAVARRAMALPAVQSDRTLAEAIGRRLKLYEAHTAYHEGP